VLFLSIHLAAYGASRWADRCPATLMEDNSEETPKPSRVEFRPYRPKLVDKDPLPDFDEDADVHSQLLLLQGWKKRNPDKCKPGTESGAILEALEETMITLMCFQDPPDGFRHVCDN